MAERHTSRRTFLGATAALATMPGVPLAAAPQAGKSDLKLGVASYSLRKLSRAQVLDAMKQLNTPYINIKEFHLPYKSTPQELAAGSKEFRDAGLTILGGGTISLQKDNDDDIRFYFDYAKAAGMPLMVIAPTHQSMPRIEKFVKEYNIKVAVHNHGPEDKHFPAPADALKVVKNMDPRVGLCIDVGHTARTGADVVESIREAGPRLLDMHVKDLKDLRVSKSQCIVGEGAMPMVAIFKQLKKMNYQGGVMLEYEIDADNPVPGMLRSFAHMRGLLAGLAG
jgi:sugar phosphate isomerase/epimerase